MSVGSLLRAISRSLARASAGRKLAGLALVLLVALAVLVSQVSLAGASRVRGAVLPARTVQFHKKARVVVRNLPRPRRGNDREADTELPVPTFPSLHPSLPAKPV